mmetsp:Transcript_4214/g.13403  ORF Transcript_4214/g.13403 Transcript_4214/m.13403 type:complete len:117 (+) Transcript_4214:105-455(+)
MTVKRTELLCCFYEVVLLCLCFKVAFATRNYSVSSGIQVKLNCADCIIVTRNDVINTIWVRVSIHNTNNWNTQVACFCDSNVLVVCIDYKDSVRQAAHIFDTAKAVFKLFHFTLKH